MSTNLLGSVTDPFEIHRQEEDSSSQFIALNPTESSANITRRHLLFNAEKERQDEIINNILAKNYQAAVQDVTNFIKSPQEDQNLINCAIISGGFSGSDQSVFYSLLRSINDDEIRLAFLTEEDDCQIKSVLKSINDQLVEERSVHYSDYDIEKLVQSYKDTDISIGIVIPCFEIFDPVVLERMLQIFKLRSELKVVFLLGISTNLDALYNNLSKAAIGLLNTRIFELAKSRVSLEQLIEQILLSNQDGVKLGYLPYKVLLDKYSNADLSVTAFSRGLQYATMCFYFGNPLSVFLDHDIAFEDLQTFHFRLLRQLPSFREYIESIKTQTDKDKIKHGIELLKQNKVLFDFAKAKMEGLILYKRKYSLALQILVKLQQMFNSKELKWTIDELHLLGLNSDLYAHDHVETLLFLIKKLDAPKIVNFIEYVFEGIRQFQLEDHFEVVIKALKESVDELCPDSSESEEMEDVENDPQPNPDIDERLISRDLEQIKTHLSQKRKSLISSRNKTPIDLFDKTQFQKQLLKVKNTFETFFTSTLFHYQKLVFHEIAFFVDKSRLIQKSFRAEPRAVLQTALQTPTAYLGCDCCDRMDINHEMTDITIMYRLYLECGRLINLQDWYEAFQSIIDSGEKVEPKKAQARFLRCVSELQFMGFIRETGRKKDHMNAFDEFESFMTTSLTTDLSQELGHILESKHIYAQSQDTSIKRLEIAVAGLQSQIGKIFTHPLPFITENTRFTREERMEDEIQVKLQKVCEELEELKHQIEDDGKSSGYTRPKENANSTNSLRASNGFRQSEKGISQGSIASVCSDRAPPSSTHSETNQHTQSQSADNTKDVNMDNLSPELRSQIERFLQTSNSFTYLSSPSRSRKPSVGKEVKFADELTTGGSIAESENASLRFSENGLNLSIEVKKYIDGRISSQIREFEKYRLPLLLRQWEKNGNLDIDGQFESTSHQSEVFRTSTTSKRPEKVELQPKKDGKVELKVADLMTETMPMMEPVNEPGLTPEQVNHLSELISKRVSLQTESEVKLDPKPIDEAKMRRSVATTGILKKPAVVSKGSTASESGSEKSKSQRSEEELDSDIILRKLQKKLEQKKRLIKELELSKSVKQENKSRSNPTVPQKATYHRPTLATQLKKKAFYV